MKRIQLKGIISDICPENTHVIWFDGTDEFHCTVKAFINGEWTIIGEAPIAITAEQINDPDIAMLLYIRQAIAAKNPTIKDTNNKYLYSMGKFTGDANNTVIMEVQDPDTSGVNAKNIIGITFTSTGASKEVDIPVGADKTYTIAAKGNVTYLFWDYTTPQTAAAASWTVTGTGTYTDYTTQSTGGKVLFNSAVDAIDKALADKGFNTTTLSDIKIA